MNILLSPSAPYFRLSTNAPSGSCEVDYPHDSEIFEDFNCQQTQSNVYKLTMLQPAVKSLGIAQKSKLRMSANGLLSLQHMIKVGRPGAEKTAYVDFFVISDYEEASQSD